MRTSVETLVRLSLPLGFAALLLTAGTNASVAQPPASPTGAQTVRANLATFDDLDFNVFSNQKWDQLSRSHVSDILVHWPDGHTTKGIEKHIEDLKAMFVYAPDTRIKVHPVKFGSGEWTSVIGEMEGTFTKPMSAGSGKTIAPTGKAFKLPMCTVRAMEERHHGGGVPVLGQSDLLEAARPLT